MTKLEVLAAPMYFATMGAEYLHHRNRARTEGPMPGDYERRDTLTSLAMGTGSLLVPLVAPKLLGPITPGKGRYGKALVGGAIGAAVITTIADAVVRRSEAAEAAEAGVGVPGASGARARVGAVGLADAADAAHVANPEGEAAVEAGDVAVALNAGGGDQVGSSRWTRRRRARLARKVASVGGVATVAATGVAVTTAWGHATRPSAMWQRRFLPDLGAGVLGWTVAMVGWDAVYYWNHRIWHETRFMWANHVMHHSSERYNLSTALRQSVTDPFLFLVPYSSLSLLGVRKEMVATSRSLNLLYQYWVHTDAIDRMGRFEEVGNTPSHHRVHHGVNPQYIDRNHGGILILWDRLFGTFVREDEPVVYGLTKNIHTFNPLRVATHEYADIFRDVANSTTWRDRLSFVLRGPGWAYARHREAEQGEPGALDLTPAAAGIA